MKKIILGIVVTLSLPLLAQQQFVSGTYLPSRIDDPSSRSHCPFYINAAQKSDELKLQVEYSDDKLVSFKTITFPYYGENILEVDNINGGWKNDSQIDNRMAHIKRKMKADSDSPDQLIIKMEGHGWLKDPFSGRIPIWTSQKTQIAVEVISPRSFKATKKSGTLSLKDDVACIYEMK